MLTLKMRHVHTILRDTCPFKISTPEKGGPAPGAIAWILLTDESKEGKPITFKGLDPAELQGQTFLQPLEDGTIWRGRIAEQLKEHSDKFANSDLMNKFKVVFGKDKVEDIIAYWLLALLYDLCFTNDEAQSILGVRKK